MSLGGSDKTTTTPNIPAELQTLLSNRTQLTADQVDAISKLFASLASGDTSLSSTFTSANAPSDALQGLQLKTDILDKTPSAGGQVERALTKGVVSSEGVRSGQDASFNQNIFDTLLRLVGSEKYPTGSQSTTTLDPGILGYINIAANLVSSYGTSGISPNNAGTYGDFGPSGGGGGGKGGLDVASFFKGIGGGGGGTFGSSTAAPAGATGGFGGSGVAFA